MYADPEAEGLGDLHLSGSHPDVEKSWHSNWSACADWHYMTLENRRKKWADGWKPRKLKVSTLPLSTLVMAVTVLLVDTVTDDVLFLLSRKVVMPAAGLPGPLWGVLTNGGDGEGDGRWTGLLPKAGVGRGECCWTKSGGGGRITCGMAGSRIKENKPW